MSVARQRGEGPAGARLQHVLAAGYAYHHPQADVGSWRDLLSPRGSRGSEPDARGSWRWNESAPPPESQWSIDRRRRMRESQAAADREAVREKPVTKMNVREWLEFLSKSPKDKLVRWYHILQEQLKALEEEQAVREREDAVREQNRIMWEANYKITLERLQAIQNRMLTMKAEAREERRWR